MLVDDGSSSPLFRRRTRRQFVKVPLAVQSVPFVAPLVLVTDAERFDGKPHDAERAVVVIQRVILEVNVHVIVHVRGGDRRRIAPPLLFDDGESDGESAGVVFVGRFPFVLFVFVFVFFYVVQVGAG